MTHLFAYGTLQHPLILSSILGREPEQEPADLKGYARYRIRDEDFPGIVPEENARVDGTVFLDIQDEEWVMLDRYESELYVRDIVTIERKSGNEQMAFAYIIPPQNRHVLTTESWDLNHYHPTHPPVAE
jgi:gamma-glutamylcyclotransferase (GGCT)/AIG2-like uncharacterized protein YtfP